MRPAAVVVHRCCRHIGNYNHLDIMRYGCAPTLQLYQTRYDICREAAHLGRYQLFDIRGRTERGERDQKAVDEA
jgi:hypothetical protein